MIAWLQAVEDVHEEYKAALLRPARSDVFQDKAHAHMQCCIALRHSLLEGAHLTQHLKYLAGSKADVIIPSASGILRLLAHVQSGMAVHKAPKKLKHIISGRARRV